jgi:CheY-like chemotaxis protein
VLKQIFRPFTHAENTSTRHLSGTGLGLTITKKLARLMGGDITVHSREGKGSTFALSFIADLAGHASTETPSATMTEFAKKPRTAPAPKGKHILLVDDHPLNRRVANLFLKPEGYRVTEAENGLEALNRLEENSFDLILLDIHMPVLDGLKTLARIRSSSNPWKDIPIIALTADAMSGDRERYLAEGMDGYISKPVDQHTLLDEIGRLLNGVRKAGAAA